MTGQLVSTRANDTGDGQGQIFLNGSVGNRIDFSVAGIAPPSMNTRSLGTKIILYPQLSSNLVDFALGIDGYTFWNSVPSGDPFRFAWYGGTTAVATLSGSGNLDVIGTITAGGNAVQRGLTSASTASGETALFVSPNTVRTL